MTKVINEESSFKDNRPEWRPMNTAPRDETTVLLYTTCHGICEAWYLQGEWTRESPLYPAEYEGSLWVCCDDAFQIEVEELEEGYLDGTVIGWMPIDMLGEIE